MQTRRSAPRSAPPARAWAGLLVAAALVLTGCSGSDGGADSSGGDAKAAAPQEGARAEGRAEDRAGAAGGESDGAKESAPPRLAPSHIIRTVSLTVQVKDAAKALEAARTATENAGGYVGDETTTRDEEDHERTEVVLRVPVERYEEVLDELEGAGKLLERSAKAEDVTDQVVDVDSRVKSQRASVARVRELMDRATRLSDVVTLEGELSSRQAELEALLARQAALKDRTSLATLTLSLSETPVERADEDDEPGFPDALAGGWDAFVTMLRWVALVVGAVLPFAAVAALLVLLWVRVLRPRRPRRAAPAPAAPPAGAPAASAPLPAARPAPEAGSGHRERPDTED
ncbi:hypothetical protein SAM40697_5251 [Streptomyces ambofaciens]|uniref:DUF4349 domain-containing protein n=1 Tax=Streptomyces ambofaciens TaxID=1889 RepID=A0ABN4PD66_STRAM|nr:DUF4349 domain-containing protein [Streptomyces ambofaciens]ANB09207.1 hypothetical protein SAM40697_5251 [Streptomyces ambofaciens]